MHDAVPMPALSCLLNPEVMADPHPVLHRLRAEAPVYRDEFLQGWVITRYADCTALLPDPRLRAFKSMSPERAVELGLEELLPYYRLLQAELFFHDPPHHTRLRRMVSGVFSPQRVEAMRASVRRLVDELIDAVVGVGSMDVVRDLAYPLPARVIARLLGIPDEDVPRFRGWADDAAPLLSVTPPPAAEVPRLAQSGRAYTEYFRILIAERRARPEGDLLSALIGVEDAGYHLSEEDLIGNAFGLLFAGHETSSGLVASSVLSLLRAPSELARLRADPALLPTAVEELLRHQTPAIFTARLAAEDIAIGGQTIRSGEPVYLMLTAANRDPAQFPDPDRLDVGRTDNRHIAFGYSHHYCLGAYLARVELQSVLEAILRRLPDLRLGDAPPEWAQSFPMRTLKSLPVAF